MQANKLATLLFVTALAGSAGMALAQSPPPSDAASHGPWHGHRHAQRHRHSAFMRALHSVNLTDAQHRQIRDLVRTHWQNLKPQMRSLHAARRAFDRAVPGTVEFSQAQSTLGQAQAQAMQTRLQAQADLRSRIYALLSDAQKAQFAGALTTDARGRS